MNVKNDAYLYSGRYIIQHSKNKLVDWSDGEHRYVPYSENPVYKEDDEAAWLYKPGEQYPPVDYAESDEEKRLKGGSY